LAALGLGLKLGPGVAKKKMGKALVRFRKRRIERRVTNYPKISFIVLTLHHEVLEVINKNKHLVADPRFGASNQLSREKIKKP
jgi:hypothetical protein